MLAGGCGTVTREPQNLALLKAEIHRYVDSGQYARDVAVVAAEAKAWIERRARQGGARLTAVFDVDETLLMNWPHMSAMDLGYITAEWQRWVDDAKAPPLEPVREVFRTARQAGVDVVLITGRPERDRAATERNLRAVGCGDFAALICRPDAAKGPTAPFKAEQRQKLVAEGRTIIANLGDQASDLAGGFAERVFKFPCPFYLTE